jgi:hypothetical protein
MNGEDETIRAAMRAGNRRLFVLVAAFGVTMIGGALLLVHYRLGIAGAVVLMLAAISFTILLMRGVSRQMAANQCGSPAMLRYNRRMMYSSIGYMAALLASVHLHNLKLLTGPLLWAVAMAPAVFVLAMVWTMARLVIEEQDEYLRYRVIKQMLFASGGLLAVATVWGFLEQFDLVVHVPAWAAVPVFATMLGLSQCFRSVRS